MDVSRFVTRETHEETHSFEHFSSSYLHRFYDGNIVSLTAQGVIEVLRPVEYDAIAFRGVSGALIAPVVAALTGKLLIACRKSSDSSHSSGRVEGPRRPVRYVIVDDFISSGKTVNTIISRAHELNNGNRCVAIVEYEYLTTDKSRYRYRGDGFHVNCSGSQQHGLTVPVLRHLSSGKEEPSEPIAVVC